MTKEMFATQASDERLMPSIRKEFLETLERRLSRQA